jgi:ribose 5-phosphate isomerase B
MKIYFASDHAGFELKEELLKFVHNELGGEVQDCGAFKNDPADDYPGLIAAAASALSRDAAAGLDSFAIVIGASGQGEAMVANRFKGVRCALYYGREGRDQIDMTGNQLGMIASTRMHNNANALSLGARFLPFDEAKDAVRTFLSTPFSNEERHARRVKQIDEVA